MHFLLSTRDKFTEIFTDRSLKFSSRIRNALLFAENVQRIIDEGDYTSELTAVTTKQTDSVHKKSFSFIFNLHKSLDIMTDEWRDILCRASEFCNGEIPEQSDKLFERMSLYYIYRYFLTAIDNLDALCTIKRIFCAYVVIGCALIAGKSESEKLFWLYSKEVEHSYENSETLEFEFMTNPDFSIETLCLLK